VTHQILHETAAKRSAGLRWTPRLGFGLAIGGSALTWAVIAAAVAAIV
jgi:hypothetical protein